MFLGSASEFFPHMSFLNADHERGDRPKQTNRRTLLPIRLSLRPMASLSIPVPCLAMPSGMVAVVFVYRRLVTMLSSVLSKSFIALLRLVQLDCLHDVHGRL